MATFEAHLLHRVLTVDRALETGEYNDWPTLEFEPTPEQAAFVKAAAAHLGVEIEDFLVATITLYLDARGL